MGSVIATVVLSFVLMEPFTYAAHRWVMHGVGMGWHRSHHQRWSRPPDPSTDSRFERNDLFPVVFSSFVLLALATGFNVAGASSLIAVAAGVTCYGAAYAFVHDIYVHRRVARFTWRSKWADRLADAHEQHHRFGGEPFGMLVPFVPSSVRARRAARTPASPAPSSPASTRVA